MTTNSSPNYARSVFAQDPTRLRQVERYMSSDIEDDYIGLDPTVREAAHHLAGCALGYHLLGLDPVAAINPAATGVEDAGNQAFVSFLGAATVAISYLVDVAVVNQDPNGLDVPMLSDHFCYVREEAARGPTSGLDGAHHLEDDDPALKFDTLVWYLRTHWVGVTGLAERFQTTPAEEMDRGEIMAALNRIEPSQWLFSLVVTGGS